MKAPTVPLEVWRNLYENCLRFMKLEPWESIGDADVFGVRDAASGEIGYCSIMGALGEVLALAVFRGSEGLEAFRRIQESAPGDTDMAAALNCLMGELEDRSALKKEDLAVIKALGLKFRGPQSYPRFRSYLPGYAPWFLNEEEAGYLAQAFEAAVEFVGQFRADPAILDEDGPDKFLVYELQKDGKGRRWTALWQEPEPAPRAEGGADAPEGLLDEILAGQPTRTGPWEVGSFVVHAPIRDRERERPYFARVLMVIDSRSKTGLATETIPAFEKEYVPLRDLVLATCRDHKVLPVEIRVADAALLEYFLPFAPKLSIKVSKRSKLPGLYEIRRFMSEQNW